MDGCRGMSVVWNTKIVRLGEEIQNHLEVVSGPERSSLKRSNEIDRSTFGAIVRARFDLHELLTGSNFEYPRKKAYSSCAFAGRYVQVQPALFRIQIRTAPTTPFSHVPLRDK